MADGRLWAIADADGRVEENHDSSITLRQIWFSNCFSGGFLKY